ncbi:hypothetical protein HYC85_010671 [Camellia sinensis]|uniref:Uncharacterized protein n=1 Tax=Camellia sinensis TaxID=4442 RepID=A0A7J7HJW9_CAMSI|nr:hypothetical protein HYC85_010671 [Camellia sinensis]
MTSCSMQMSEFGRFDLVLFIWLHDLWIDLMQETRMLMVSDVQDIIKGINHRSSPP